MDTLGNFIESYDKKQCKKETLLTKYIKNNAHPNILYIVKLGGGSKLGSFCEQFSFHKFNILTKRLKNNTGYDAIIQINNININIEIKTSTLHKSNDFMWQHIAIKHLWNILLLIGIHYNKILFFGMTRKIFEKLVTDEKITNQGNKNKNSEQGMWFKYSNVINDLKLIETNEDLLHLCSH